MLFNFASIEAMQCRKMVKWQTITHSHKISISTSNACISITCTVNCTKTNSKLRSLLKVPFKIQTKEHGALPTPKDFQFICSIVKNSANLHFSQLFCHCEIDNQQIILQDLGTMRRRKMCILTSELFSRIREKLILIYETNASITARMLFWMKKIRLTFSKIFAVFGILYLNCMIWNAMIEVWWDIRISINLYK